MPPATASDTIKEGSKEKSGPTSLPLGKLFWKKVSLVVRPLLGPGDRDDSVMISSGPVDVDDSEVIVLLPD